MVVVEAGERSGALITADLALDLGRPVLAVPGSAGSPAVAGCHGLIRSGAALCERADDVIAEVPAGAWSAAGPAPPDPEGLAGRALEHLRRQPAALDRLAADLGAAAPELGATLARLEVEGLVVRGDAGRWWAAPSAGSRAA